MADEPEVKVASDTDAQVQFGKGPFYRQGKRMSVRAAIGYAVASLAALAPIFLISAPDRPDNDAKERVKSPESSDLEAGEKGPNLESYSIAHEKAKNEDRHKRAHLTIRYQGLESVDRPHASAVPPGSLVKAVLISGAANGPVRAELKEPLTLNGETLLPEGSVLLGAGQSTESRLMIHFTQVVFKNGKAESVDAAAIDGGDRIAGLKGSKVGRYAMKLGASVGLNFVSGLSEGLQEKETVGQQVVNNASTKNALLNGASHASLDLANETMADLKNQSPVIEVEAGREIFILFGATN
jgi:type IV secretory pathway VirB10-like protein